MEGDGPLRIPPTARPRRSLRSWPRWQRVAAVVVTVVLTAVAISAVLNREVTRRLNTLPQVTSTTTGPTTTTTIVGRQPIRRAVGAIQPVETSTTIPATSTTLEPPDVPDAAELLIADLDKMPVDEEHDKDYSAGAFGFWADSDADGCNTPEEVLIAQSKAQVRHTATCRVLSGRWESPYDGLVITEGRDITVDHVIALEEAWQSGAWKWTDGERNHFLNDLEHANALLAVSRQINDQKGHKDPGEWLPPVDAFRCTYLRLWIDLKTAWKLSIDAGEREAIAAAALSC